MCYTFDAILATLEDMGEDSDGMKATQATGLLLQIKTFHFLLSLIMFDKILSITKGLSDVLQRATLDLAKAVMIWFQEPLKTFELTDTGVVSLLM